MTTSAQAAPIDYTITFTAIEGVVPVRASGGFTYDADVPQFTNLLVLWRGVEFDLTTKANNPSAGGCGAVGRGPAPGFAILSGSTSCTSNQLWLLTKGVQHNNGREVGHSGRVVHLGIIGRASTHA